MNIIVGIGAALLTQLPSLLVLAVAAAIAMVRHKRHPQVSIIVLVYALIEFLLIVTGTALQFVLPMQMQQTGQSIATIGAALAVIGLGRSVIGALTLALLLWATFGWRTDG